jgi:hypothetical protein
MVVVLHEAVGVAKPVVPLDDYFQDGKEILTILIIAKYSVPRISTGCNMIGGSRIFDS